MFLCASTSVVQRFPDSLLPLFQWPWVSTQCVLANQAGAAEGCFVSESGEILVGGMCPSTSPHQVCVWLPFFPHLIDTWSLQWPPSTVQIYELSELMNSHKTWCPHLRTNITVCLYAAGKRQKLLQMMWGERELLEPWQHLCVPPFWLCWVVSQWDYILLTELFIHSVTQLSSEGWQLACLRNKLCPATCVVFSLKCSFHDVRSVMEVL